MKSQDELFIDQVLEATLKSTRYGSKEFGEEVNSLTKNLLLRHVQSPSKHLILLVRTSVVSGSLLNTNRRSAEAITKLISLPPPVPPAPPVPAQAAASRASK